MKKSTLWLIPGLVAVASMGWTVACSSSDELPADDTSNGDAGQADTGSKSDAATDSGLRDAAGDAEIPDAGPIDDFMTACARIDACATGNTPLIGMNGCYKWITAMSLFGDLSAKDKTTIENLKCKMAATSCSGVRACDKPLNDYASQCATQGGGELCVGNVHVVCSWDDPSVPTAVTDCSGDGNICAGIEGSMAASCAKKACDPASDPAPEPSCNGTVFTECTYYGAEQETDCANLSRGINAKPIGKVTTVFNACGAITVGEPPDEFTYLTCKGDGPACDGGASATRCDGTVIEGCTNHQQVRRDCAQALPAGQGCTVLSGDDVPDELQGSYACAPVNPPCKESDNEACDVATGIVSFCALTEAKSVSCKALGYSGCKTTTGTDGRVAASCF